MAALQCYLREHGWAHEGHDKWHKPGHNGGADWEINIDDTWLSIRKQLKESEVWERVQRLNKHALFHGTSHMASGILVHEIE